METGKFQSVYYTPSHEWLLPVGDGVKLGITQYAQQQLGEVVFVELPVVERVYQLNQAICIVESIKTASEIDAPFPCTVIGVNHNLSKHPSTLNSSPQFDGWICIVRPHEEDWHSLLVSESNYLDVLKKTTVAIT